MEIHLPLTEKQRKLLTFIKERIRATMPPTIREIAQEMGFSSTGTVRDYLTALQKKGYLKLSEATSRGIELTDKAKGIPILGTIPAGRPALAYEEIEGYIDPYDLFLGRLSDTDVFALKVKGESMIEAGIMDGDIAIIKKAQHAENGDIIAALIDGSNEATLKRLRQKNSTYYLEAANHNYGPLHVKFSILGRLITVIRKY